MPRAALSLLLAAVGATPEILAEPAAAPNGGPRILRAVRAAGPIRVDGLLDEEDWSRATPAAGFTQRHPAEGSPETQRTEVRVLYDDERLLVGARMHDAEPSRLVAREMKEDAELPYDDAFAIFLDTFHDRRNGFFFEVNPLGARADALVFDEGRNNSHDWDGVWDVATRVDESGWTAEIEIPFKTLHFDPQGDGAWGVQFRRIVRRNAEDDWWSPIPRNEDEWRLSRAGELTGLEGIRQGHSLSVKPYALGAGTDRPTLGEEDAGAHGDAGVDVRWDVTPNLAAVVTVNTDFAETEVDNQQINTTRFPLFFPEKREFFLESKGHFDFGYKKPGLGTPLGVIPFFSRRIGLGPRQIATGTIDAPVPILGGAKLAGRVGRTNVGFLAARTDETASSPATDFGVLRAGRDILSRSNVGVIGVFKNPAGPDDPLDPNDLSAGFHANGTYGADLNLSVLENFRFGGAFLRSDTPGLDGRDAVRRAYADWSDDRWELEFGYTDIGENFNPEVGFVRRTGIEEAVGFLGWSWRSDAAPIRRLAPHARTTYTMDQDHDLATRWQHWAVAAEFHDGSSLELAWNPSFDELEDEFVLDDDGNAVVRPGAYDVETWTVHWEGDGSRVVSGRVFTEFGDFFDGTIVTLDANVRARPSRFFKLEVGANRVSIDLPERPAAGTPQNPLPATAAAEFRTLIVQTNLGVTFTTRLYADALIQYNTGVDDVSTNLRLNWKYRPGSDLYVVYTERNDIEGLPADVTDRSLTVKWTYLMSF